MSQRPDISLELAVLRGRLKNTDPWFAEAAPVTVAAWEKLKDGMITGIDGAARLTGNTKRNPEEKS